MRSEDTLDDDGCRAGVVDIEWTGDVDFGYLKQLQRSSIID